MDGKFEFYGDMVGMIIVGNDGRREYRYIIQP